MAELAAAGAVIGLISGILSIIDAAKRVYDAAKDATHLPKAFREVAQRLPLVHNTLLILLRDAQAGH
jgi:hypothetical protein